jgi:hypothetical protein
MKQGKSKTSISLDPDFPKGPWAISIHYDGVPDGIPIGDLRLQQDAAVNTQYLGAMEFASDPNFGDIKGKAYSVEVFIGTKPGVIIFQIVDAATDYNPNTSTEYQFIFVGFYGQNGLENGTAKVPKGFGRSGPGDEGETVHWTSEPHQGHSQSKHSK